MLKLALTVRSVKMGALEPSEGGKFIRDVINGDRDQDQGKVIRANMIQPW